MKNNKANIEQLANGLKSIFLILGGAFILALLGAMVDRVRVSGHNLQVTNDASSNLQFISVQIETFQLYLVLFTVIIAVISFIGYKELVDRAEKKAEEVAKKKTEEILAEYLKRSKSVGVNQSSASVNQTPSDDIPF